jgi:hypothetical protein
MLTMHRFAEEVGHSVMANTCNDGVGVLSVCFLTVEVCERTDATEPERNFGRNVEELSGAGRRRLGAGAGVSIGNVFNFFSNGGCGGCAGQRSGNSVA